MPSTHTKLPPIDLIKQQTPADKNVPRPELYFDERPLAEILISGGRLDMQGMKSHFDLVFGD